MGCFHIIYFISQLRSSWLFFLLHVTLSGSLLVFSLSTVDLETGQLRRNKYLKKSIICPKNIRRNLGGKKNKILQELSINLRKDSIATQSDRVRSSLTLTSLDFFVAYSF